MIERDDTIIQTTEAMAGWTKGVAVKPKSASVMAFNKRGLVLVTPWKRDPRYVSIPGGKGDPGENHRQIAVREFYEETGYRLDPMKLEKIVHDPFDTRDYVGYITLEDLSDVVFQPLPGETTPFWSPRAVLLDPNKCMYATFSEKAWLCLSDDPEAG
jgi:8-oxo-dGTP pyrophosphatase MutT (NUDIX family)